MVKSFWPLKNNQSVIDAIKKHNSRNKALSIAIYDLSIFYTIIPHNKLQNVTRELNSFCFKAGKRQFIVVITLVLRGLTIKEI